MKDVRTWLGGIGLAQYADAFEANDVEMDLLKDVDDQLLKDNGMAIVGPASAAAPLTGSKAVRDRGYVDLNPGHRRHLLAAAYLSRVSAGLSKRLSTAIVTGSYFALSALILVWFGLNSTGLIAVFGMSLPLAVAIRATMTSTAPETYTGPMA
jgi:hypothetical protein